MCIYADVRVVRAKAFDFIANDDCRMKYVPQKCDGYFTGVEMGCDVNLITSHRLCNFGPFIFSAFHILEVLKQTKPAKNNITCTRSSAENIKSLLFSRYICVINIL